MTYNGNYEFKHICQYISEDYNSMNFAELTDTFFADIPFSYAPLDRIKVVENCENPLLMEASVLLKEDPNRFYTWGAHKRENPYESWEHLISSDSEKK